jgi:3-oxoacyl-[acyl-carrier-protein] synthase II
MITGVGAVSTCGNGADELWAGLGRPAPTRPRTVHDFDPSPWFEAKEARRTDRFTQFAVAAAAEAMAHAGLGDESVDRIDPWRRGVVVGTGVGGLTTLEDQIMTYHDQGPRRVSPFLVPMMMANAAAAAVSLRHGLQGPCETVATACATGTHAIGAAAALIEAGRCDLVVAGASEAAMTPVGIQGFTNLTALSPSGCSRPFDADRDGFVMGEGAGIVVLESEAAAAARGATPLAEVAGWASTADAHHVTAPRPDGAAAAACMALVLDQAGVELGDVAQVSAHGTSTIRNDEAEARALHALFGDACGGSTPPVTAAKGVLGHALGAAGAIEAVAVVQSMHHGSLPPTGGHASTDPGLPAIDLVIGELRGWTPGPTLSNSFGFGGHNGCLVLVPPGWTR